tara:strand:+ start:591 stop:704 length:114 start_codon:yes stop_codon:yes gene_type:complete
VDYLLLGERNGKVIGTMSNIVVKNAREKKNCFNLVEK